MRILVAAAALLLLTKPALADGDLYAAIGYSPSSKAVGIAKDKTSKEEAEQAASANCGASSCKAFFVKNGCIALAVAKDAWATDWGVDLPDANQKAIAGCGKYTKSSCKVRTTACVSGTELPQTADSKVCRDGQSPPDERIRSCTAMRTAKDATAGSKRIALSNRAEAWESKGDNARAIADYTEALSFDPKSSYLYQARGFLFVQQNDERCVADFDKAVQLDPKSGEAYRNRGNAKIGFVGFNAAIPDLMKAIELDPKDDIAYRILAHAKYELALSNNTSFDGALTAIDKAIELAPGKAVNHTRRGTILSAMKDYDRAFVAYGEAIRIEPKDADLYLSRGDAYTDKGDFDKAISDYDQAISLDPKHVRAHNHRGDAYSAKGDNDRAIADYDQAITLDPKNKRAYRARGVAYLYNNAPQKALADFTQVSVLDAKSASIALWLDIARHRNNAPSELSNATKTLDMMAWPAPIVRLYLGQTTPAEVMAAASDKYDRCQASFFIGELSLGGGLKDEARRQFTQVVNDCPRDFDEWIAANAELRALGVTANPSGASRLINGISGLFGRAKPEEKSPTAVEEKGRVAAVVPPISSTGREASGKPGEQPPDAQSAPELPSFPGCNTMKPKTGHDEKSAVLFAEKGSDAARSAARQALTASGWKIKTDQAVSGPDFSSFLLLVQVHSADIVVLCGPSKDALVKQGREFEIFP